jgi:8-oxo-dGTP diphosphatase
VRRAASATLALLKRRSPLAQAAADHMHRHVHQEEVFTVLSGVGEAALGGGRTVQLRRGDLLRVAPSEPRALRALPQGPANPGGEDLHVLVVGGSTLGGPFPHDPRARVLLDDRLSLFAELPPWLPAGSAEAAAAAAHNAVREVAEAEHVMRLRWRLAERQAKLQALHARRAAAKAAHPATTATVLVSAVALLDDAGRVLLARRPLGKSHANKYEYPGGKVEPGESPQAGLYRELAEELDIAVHPDDMFPLAFSSVSGEKNCLLLMLFGARRWTGTPRGAEGQPVQWVTVNELGVRVCCVSMACHSPLLCNEQATDARCCGAVGGI